LGLSGAGAGDQRFKMNRRGVASTYIVHARVGRAYRVGATYKDAAHAAGGTHWTYLKVT
jgi:hypothetical protein